MPAEAVERSDAKLELTLDMASARLFSTRRFARYCTNFLAKLRAAVEIVFLTIWKGIRCHLWCM
jgi:hypothetical protein